MSGAVDRICTHPQYPNKSKEDLTTHLALGSSGEGGHQQNCPPPARWDPRGGSLAYRLGLRAVNSPTWIPRIRSRQLLSLDKKSPG